MRSPSRRTRRRGRRCSTSSNFSPRWQSTPTSALAGSGGDHDGRGRPPPPSPRRWGMIQTNAPADPRIHEAATRMAKRFVWVIQAILRDEERGDALREAYQIAREELEAYRAGGTKS